MTQISSIAVLGAGQMGRGIAQLCATSGLHAAIYDSTPGQAAAALAAIGKSLARAADKGTITATNAAAALARIIPHNTPGEWLTHAGMVIEAITENFAAKTALYQLTEPRLNATAIFASNTSSYSIAKLAAGLARPAQFVGVHFMNPAPRMALVEIIPGEKTSAETTAAAEVFAAGLGKQTVRSADSPGFITNRILMPLINEAAYALHHNIGSAPDIDLAMTLGMNHPMGPLTLADFIGLDTCLAVLRTLHEGLGDDKFTPCPLLCQLVSEGHLGKKSGRGFYDYPA